MTERTFEVEMDLHVTVIVHNEDVITRCVENHDDQGRPQPDVSGGTGFRNVFAPLDTAEKVVEELAAYVVLSGHHDISYVDGWADLDQSAVTVLVERYPAMDVVEK